MHLICFLAASFAALTVYAQNLNIGGTGGGISLGQPVIPPDNGGGISVGGDPGSIPPAPGSAFNSGTNSQGNGVSLGVDSPSGPSGGAGIGNGGPVPGPSNPPSGGSGVIVVDNGEGTVIPGPGTATDNVNPNPTNNNNNNGNTGGGINNNRGFGSINFPDFSNFETIGNNFPSRPSGGNQNGGGTDLNSGLFHNPGFPNSAIPSFGNNNNNNNNNNPSTGLNGNSNNNNSPFPDLSSINFDFGLGNTGSSGFPSDFGSGSGLFPPFSGNSGFPGGGSGGLNLPPIDTNPGGRYGHTACQTPPPETLPVQVSNTPLPQNIVNAFFLEASVRPEIQILAQFFNTTTGDVSQAKIEDDTIACPANYSVLTKFITAQNTECWVVPPPTQPPVMYAQCRCTKCRSSSTVGRYSANTCKSKLSTVTVVAFCPLATPPKTLPIRIQIPTSCQCNLARSDNRFYLK